MKLKSQFIYSSDHDGETIAMCISRDVLKGLLANYPNVAKHWKKVAKVRRREFRRLLFLARTILEEPSHPGFRHDKNGVYLLKNFEDIVMETDFADEELDVIDKDERE